jgi:hypothetical protein
MMGRRVALSKQSSAHRVSQRSIDCAAREANQCIRAKRHCCLLCETLCALDCLRCRDTTGAARVAPLSQPRAIGTAAREAPPK